MDGGTWEVLHRVGELEREMEGGRKGWMAYFNYFRIEFTFNILISRMFVQMGIQMCVQMGISRKTQSVPPARKDTGLPVSVIVDEN